MFRKMLFDTLHVNHSEALSDYGTVAQNNTVLLYETPITIINRLEAPHPNEECYITKYPPFSYTGYNIKSYCMDGRV